MPQSKETSDLNMARLKEIAQWEVNGPNLGFKTLHQLHAALPAIIYEIESLSAENEQLHTDNINRITAMNDLLKSPNGVVPKSADGFYDCRIGIFL
jgi:hypothetical protein